MSTNDETERQLHELSKRIDNLERAIAVLATALRCREAADQIPGLKDRDFGEMTGLRIKRWTEGWRAEFGRILK